MRFCPHNTVCIHRGGFRDSLEESGLVREEWWLLGAGAHGIHTEEIKRLLSNKPTSSEAFTCGNKLHCTEQQGFFSFQQTCVFTTVTSQASCFEISQL